MSNRRNSQSMRRNATKGAITRWCPECKRKAALDTYGKCLYCGFVWRGRNSAKMALYEAWVDAGAVKP